MTELARDLDTLWLCLAAFLVFIMQAGFAYVEAGFTRAKNVINILMKNIADFCIGSIAFWLIGFGIMFGPLLISATGVGTPALADSYLDKNGLPDSFNYAFFIFQLVFCMTAATITSGAMAERTKFGGYLIYSAIVSSLIYPVYGSFTWSNLFDGENTGFLAAMGFHDFAGSTVVHSVGAWAGLAGTMVLGPRTGKYNSDGTISPIFGHNMSMSVLGAFLLWFGWFGFNPGSTGTIKGGSFAVIAVNTNMAAAAGGLTTLFMSWLLFKKSDISMVINGALGGLVAITAVCDSVTIGSSVLIGLIAGMLVMAFVVLFEKIKIDDPVGAVSVHGIAGAWGTISFAFFAHPSMGEQKAGLFYGGGIELLWPQVVGVLVAFVWAFGTAGLVFLILKKINLLRVSREEEEEGLDIMEHGNEAYWTEH